MGRITFLACFAFALVAETPDAWVRKGDELMQRGRETADAAYCSRAEAAYRKALEGNPKQVGALIGMAWVNGVRHEFEASIDWARKALAANPRSAAAHGLIGDAAVELGNYELAFEEYQKMLDERLDMMSYSRSAHLLQLTGDTRKSAWLMRKAIAAGSPYGENVAWCRAQLALLLFAEGAYLPAHQVLEEGMAASPNDYRLLAAMGKVKAAMGETQAAIEFYRRSVAIAPQQDVVAALGDLYRLVGDTPQMNKQYALVETIARLNKANGVTGDLLTAKFYADHDRNLAEALRLAEEEYRTRKNVYAADTLAWCALKNGKLDLAAKAIREAISRKTPEALFHFHEGMILEAAGDTGAARVAFYKALSINPNFDPVQAPIARHKIEELGSRNAGPASER